MHNNIDAKLKEFFDEHKVLPFQWGVEDCSHFSAQWVNKFTGKNIENDMPDYTSEAEAMSVLAGLGYSSQEDSVDHYFKRVKKNFLMRGDLVGHYFHGAGYMAIGVYAGEVSMFKSAEGIQLVSHKDIDRHLCWRVA